MTTDLEAAVARLKRDLATPGTVTGCVVDGNHLRLLLADWKRQGKMLDVCSVVHDHNVKLKAERDAARAEVERLTKEADAANRIVRDDHNEMKALKAELARLRERDARVRAVLGNPGIDRQTAINRALELLKETP
jgi:uncharacterized protein (DUF3084 family)